MKIKQNQSLNNDNSINQMSTQTPIKTGDTTFVDGLKDLDMVNTMKESMENENSVELPKADVDTTPSKKIDDFCKSNIVYVVKNKDTKKSEKAKGKDSLVDLDETQKVLENEVENLGKFENISDAKNEKVSEKVFEKTEVKDLEIENKIEDRLQPKNEVKTSEIKNKQPEIKTVSNDVKNEIKIISEIKNETKQFEKKDVLTETNNEAENVSEIKNEVKQPILNKVENKSAQKIDDNLNKIDEKPKMVMEEVLPEKEISRKNPKAVVDEFVVDVKDVNKNDKLEKTEDKFSELKDTIKSFNELPIKKAEKAENLSVKNIDRKETNKAKEINLEKNNVKNHVSEDIYAKKEDLAEKILDILPNLKQYDKVLLDDNKFNTKNDVDVNPKIIDGNVVNLVKDDFAKNNFDEVKLNVEDFKPEIVKEQLSSHIKDLEAVKDFGQNQVKQDKLVVGKAEIKRDKFSIDKKELKPENKAILSDNLQQKIDVKDIKNDVLSEILNTKEDIENEIPRMEDVVPKQLRNEGIKNEIKQPETKNVSVDVKNEAKNVSETFENKSENKSQTSVEIKTPEMKKVEIKPVQNDDKNIENKVETKVENKLQPKIEVNTPEMKKVEVKPVQNNDKNIENKVEIKEEIKQPKIEKVLSNIENKVETKLENKPQLKTDINNLKVEKVSTDKKTNAEMKPQLKHEIKMSETKKVSVDVKNEFKQPEMKTVEAKPVEASELNMDKTLKVNDEVKQPVQKVSVKAENEKPVQKQEDLITPIGRVAVEPAKKQPLEDLNKFLNEIMAEDTVESLKSKDVSMIDDNTLLTEEIKNYYNLNKAQNFEVSDDVKNVINERIAEISDLTEIVETSQEAKSIQKELKSMEVQKPQSKKVETKSLKMTEQDANFFIDLVKNNQETNQTVKDTTVQMLQDVQNLADDAQQATKVSKALSDMMSEAMKTNKPFRIDFDKNISVIIKIDREGKISAEFLPGDKAVEQYLRTQLPMLRQKFNDENINYKDLDYRQSNSGRQNRERRKRGE